MTTKVPRTDPPSLRFVLDACRPHRRWIAALIGLSAIVATATALVPALAGIMLARSGPTWAIATGLFAACLLAVRGVLRQQLSHLGRTAMLSHTAKVVATRSSLGTASQAADRIEFKLLTSSFAAAQLLAESAPTFIGNAVAIMALLPCVAWFASWRVAVLALPVLGVLAFSMFLLRGVLSGRMKKAHAAALTLSDEAALLLRGHLELAASARLDGQAGRVSDRALVYSDALRRSERASAFGGRIPLFAAGAVAVMLWWLWLGDRADLLSSGLAKLLIVGSAVPMVAGLARALNEARRELRDIAPVVALLEMPPAPRSKPDAVALSAAETIRFDDVSFGYAPKSDPLAIQNVSLAWHASELLAITGPNGSGKSTLIRLLLRLADPDEGAVRVGSTDLREGDLDRWRREIAYLPQRPFLPESATLRGVVSAFGCEVSEQVLLDVLTDVGLRTKLERYHEQDPLAAPVAILSAGERQRFALARVLAQDAPILILDEPDANLDAAGLDILTSVLPRLAKCRRILLVAHDQRLLACASRVIELRSTAALVTVAATSS